MKKLSVIRLLSILLVFAFVFGCMVGCGEDTGNTSSLGDEILGEITVDGDDDSDVSDVTDDGDEPSSKVEVTTGSSKINLKDLKGQTVTMLMWRELNASEKKVIKNFESSTGIKVKYTVVAQKDYMTKVAAEVAAKSGLDICAIQSGGMSIMSGETYASNFPVGTVSTMQPFFEATKQDPKDSIWAKSWMDPYKINNKYYGVAIAGGWHTLSTVVFYNKDMFEEYGIKTPRELWKAGNWNWDTFKNCSRQIVESSAKKDKDHPKIGFASRDSYAFMLSSGCDYVAYDGKKFTNSSNDNKLKAAWRFSETMSDEGYQYKPDAGGNYPMMFTQGELAMYAEGSYCMANVGMLGDYAYDLDDIDFEIDAVPFPSPKGQKAIAIHRGNLFGIAKNSKNPVAAGVFLRFWLDPKNALPFSKIAINNNMRDVFNWINSESTPKKAYLAGGVLGYQDTEKMGNMTYRLLAWKPEQIDSTIAMFKPFIDTCCKNANKVLN